jgi:serine/threonine-protein kinase
LSEAYLLAGRVQDAQAMAARALSLARQRKERGVEAWALRLLAEIAAHADSPDADRAERYYRQALEITRAFYGPDHYKTASNLTMLARSLLFQEKYDEAVALLQQALAIQERVFGKVHPRVASALNELGNVAIKRDRPDDAEQYFRRMLDIYHSVYGDKHYLIGIAVSNLAGAYMVRKEYARAEELYRDAVRRFTEAQSADHLNTGIARIKLGRSLLRQRRYAEAERETLAGYQIVSKQASPSVSWLQSARKDLAAVYDSLKQPEKAAKFRAEIAKAEGPGGGKPK